jgi:hypothetical protein
MVLNSILNRDRDLINNLEEFEQVMPPDSYRDCFGISNFTKFKLYCQPKKIILTL